MSAVSVATGAGAVGTAGPWSGPLLAASWRAVGRAPVLAPCAAAALLLLGTLPWQDTSRATDVLDGVAVLLACAFAGTTDDPAGELAAASPYPSRVRVAARVLVGLAVAAPLAVLSVVVIVTRNAALPVAPALVEMVGYGAGAVAIGSGLRVWRDLHRPSYLASIGVLGLALLTYMAPRGWTMVHPQTWGPPWEAALIRWSALTLLAVGVLTATLRDRAAE